ncbi:hypothetical protein ABNQ39_11270 [Azospirillum sp. A26]|uniref:hypothetical protein n=1 Tax=Azospirillum sp. A26 TaxID=3160607 RepID=UPI00366E866B
MLTRRSFLAGLFAAPAIVRASVIMPVQTIIIPPPFMVGDTIDVRLGAWKALGVYVLTGRVRRLEGDNVIIGNGYYGTDFGEVAIPRSWVKLDEGLPGNRINNPSMRHRLIRNERSSGLMYPEDIHDPRVKALAGRVA